jgi:uncharacterized membrane protein YGL010W
MGGKTWQGKTWSQWIDDYSQSHQTKINQITHKIEIPMIAVSILLILPSLFFAGLWKIALGLFAIGWILQFIGHYFEGKPPEFLKDWRFLFVGLRWWFAKLRS